MMIENQPLETVEPAKIAEYAAAKRAGGWRLVQISCTSLADAFELTYSFDKDYALQNARVIQPREGAPLPSITASYLAGFTYENELQDLFGVRLSGLALDFKGQFYRLRAKTPMSEPHVTTKPAAKPAANPTPGN
ncbi:MAG: NADH-quinone oxidoreductase subunit C [Spirochaetes bacterium]|nr:NADH-quinone oxidoreductase subunit C [Spirochaetota bacterium]